MADTAAAIQTQGSTNIDAITATTGFGAIVRQRVGLDSIFAAGNAVSGSGTGVAIGMLAAALFDGTNYTQLAALSAAGGGIGVAKVEPVNGAATVAISGANTAITLTLGAVAAQRNHLKTINVSYLGGTPAAAFEVDANDNAGSIQRIFFQAGTFQPMQFWFGENGIANLVVNTPMTVVIPALGGSIQGALNVSYWVG